MISIVCSTKEPNEEFKAHVLKTCGLPKAEFTFYENKGEFSLTEVYNRGLNDAVNDIVVFLHDDIEIETKNWGSKLMKLYKRNPEHGILGVAGSKYLPESGKWWEDPRKMYGRVWHSHNGKKWLSAYSENLANKIEDVVLVDGVFFSVVKSRLKENFDESVEGFHFYDLDFCVKNYLNGVKIGVHTNIVITHMSIGQTNEQWEENRKKFVEKYKENLPQKINKIFKPNHKFKVLIGCLSFQNFTGSELHVYELSRQLVKQGCEVTICSNCGGDIAKKALACGIKLANIQEPPGYKLGDGVWGMTTPDGKQMVSQKGSLYRTEPAKFDIMHLNHKPIAEHLLALYPEVEAISTIHSEVIDLEHPVKHNNIKRYVAIRPEIKDYIVEEHDIDENMVDVIYNPIDQDRFKPKTVNTGENKRTLFVGTIDYLRRETLIDLINRTKEEDGELWVVGKENGVNIQELIQGHDHVSYFGPTWNVEKYIHQCDETAGILLGRTTIEGWLCGKPGWIYDINPSGEIQSKALHQVPEDVDKFRGSTVASSIIEEYKKVLQ